MNSDSGTPGRDIEIAILHQISRAVLHERNVSKLLKLVLGVLYREIGFERGTFTLLRDDTLYIEASQGLTEAEIRRGKYKLGEGITGRVAELASPILIPDISRDPNFLNRTKTRDQLKNTAFLCVPILHMEKVIGTLSMDRTVTPEVNLKRDMKLLETVANITAEAVASCLLEHEEKERLLAENQSLREQLDRKDASTPENGRLIGSCHSMREVFRLIEQASLMDAPILIRGNAGTGRETVAREIWKKSSRSDKPFVTVLCSSVPGNQLEKELFGHNTRFRGATEKRSGGQSLLEEAEGGILYLDEVGDLNVPVQMRLLQLLQEHCWTRNGSLKRIPANVRIFASTGKNLENMISEGVFREDFYYRLNVFPILLPDLRNRKSDIILLAEHFLDQYAARYNKKIKKLSAPAVNMLMSYHWPGNVSELENCMERAVLACPDETVSGYYLPPSLQAAVSAPAGKITDRDGTVNFPLLVSTFERELIVDALKSCGGNVAAAAKFLQLTDRVIRYKIKQLKIQTELYRNTGFSGKVKG